MRLARILGVFALSLLAGVDPRAQGAARPYGAATPQEVVSTLQKATAARDYATAFSLVAPDARKALASEAVTGVLMVLAFSNPDDGMASGKPLPKAELDKKRQAYRAALDAAKAAFKPYGFDALIGKPVLAAETQKSIDGGLAKADTVVLLNSVMTTMDKVGPLLGMKREDKSSLPFDLGTVSGYKVAGDKATATSGKETVDFIRLDGRWYLNPPAPKPGK